MITGISKNFQLLTWKREVFFQAALKKENKTKKKQQCRLAMTVDSLTAQMSEKHSDQFVLIAH